MRRTALVALLIAAACGSKAPPPHTGTTKTGAHAPGGLQRGYATWYGTSPGQEGGPTASGERFHRSALTAAHRTLPMGTVVRVTELNSGRSVVVRINDRGPYGDKSRIIDLSQAAAKQLGIIDAGVAPVTIEILSRPDR
jgi:rare lipoprotein A